MTDLALPQLMQRFECNHCGNCCSNMTEGPPLYARDIRRLAAHFEMSPERFLDAYAVCGTERPTEQGIQIEIPRATLSLVGKRCIFFFEERCSVHEIKPFLCRASPYIRCVLEDPARVAALEGFCEGIGKGPRISEEQVESFLDEEESLELEDIEAYLEHGFLSGLFEFDSHLEGDTP